MIWEETLGPVDLKTFLKLGESNWVIYSVWFQPWLISFFVRKKIKQIKCDIYHSLLEYCDGYVLIMCQNMRSL